MALSHSQSVLAAIGDDLPDCSADPQTGAAVDAGVHRRVAAAGDRQDLPRPSRRRLPAHDGGPVEAFELSPGDVALAEQLPGLTAQSDLDSTQAQMRLFDRLILADGVAKVVDVGHA